MTVGTDTLALGQLPLFNGLAAAQLEFINSRLRRKTFPAGTDIITAEQPGELAYIILSGTVKIHIEQADGSTVILAILGAGEIVGEMSLLEKIDRSATVVTLEDSTLVWMNRDTFSECLHAIPVLTTNLVRIVSRRLRLANAQIQSLATLDVFGRVARQLLAFAQEYGQPTPGGRLIPLRLTQTDLAGLVGASRVRVNQVLVFYRQQNYITIDHNYHITLLNTQALQQRCR